MEILYILSAKASFLLDSVNSDLTSGQIIGGGGAEAAQATAAAGDAADVVAATPPTLMESIMSMAPTILIYGGIIFALYWFMFRPQRKKEKEMQQMRSALKTGDNIVTSSGFYGKIVDVEDNSFVIEFGTNKGIRIPVRKSEILALPSQPAVSPSSSSSDKKND